MDVIFAFGQSCTQGRKNAELQTEQMAAFAHVGEMLNFILIYDRHRLDIQSKLFAVDVES